MERTLTAARATQEGVIGDYNYHEINGELWTVRDHKADPTFNFGCPATLPLDRKGKAFCPGISMAEYDNSHWLYQYLQVDSDHADFRLFTGVLRDSDPDDKCLNLFLTWPEDANLLVLAIDWEDDHAPAEIGIDSNFGRVFNAQYFERRSATDDFWGLDLWIFPALDHFKNELSRINEATAREIAMGDAYMATFEPAKRVFLPYMQDLWWNDGSEVLRDFELAWRADCAVLCRSSDDRHSQKGCFPYTLDGTQQLAAFIAELKQEAK